MKKMKTLLIFIIGLTSLFLSLFCKSTNKPEKTVSTAEIKHLNQEIRCTLDSVKQKGEEVRELKQKIQEIKKP